MSDDAYENTGAQNGPGAVAPGTTAPGDLPAEAAQVEALLDGLRALALLWQLRALDTVWTRWAQLASESAESAESSADSTESTHTAGSAGTAGAQDRARAAAAMSVFADGIERTFAEFAAVSRRLEPALAGGADVIRRRPIEGLVTGLSTTARGKVEDVLTRTPDLAEATRAHLADMDSTAAAAVAHLRAEIDTVARGGRSDGDYDPATEAVIGAVATGIGGWVGPLGVIVVEGFAHSETGAAIVEAIGDAISDGVHAVLDFFFG